MYYSLTYFAILYKAEISVVSTEFLVRPVRKVFSTFVLSDKDNVLN